MKIYENLIQISSILFNLFKTQTVHFYMTVEEKGCTNTVLVYVTVL